MKRTAKQEILKRLAEAGKPLACHELNIADYSQNCLATRLPELAKAGLVVGTKREGKAFKEWQLSGQISLPL